jgi:hypothetical protein
MSCTTELGLQVQEVVKKWMDGHTQLEAVWNVCEVHRAPGDIIISIHQTDGVRRLTSKTSKTAPIITPEVEAKILNWLDTLSQQSLVDPADLSLVLMN